MGFYGLTPNEAIRRRHVSQEAAETVPRDFWLGVGSPYATPAGYITLRVCSRFDQVGIVVMTGDQAERLGAELQAMAYQLEKLRPKTTEGKR